jgi:hypothetical protein
MTLKLPQIGGPLKSVNYEPSNPWDLANLKREFNRRDAELKRLDDESLKKGCDIQVGMGRLILRSPNGKQWSITVGDTGVLTAVAL